ncbi:MAG: hypothetical protein HC845_14310 [Akkermansiaceae bacterium]|nr:hypothetical protein [Akkermansiaceae bacterium]
MSSNLLFTLIAVGMLSSCVSYYEIPKNYSGPTATLKDSSIATHFAKAAVFKVAEIEGKTPKSSPMATPYGGGMGVTLRESSRPVPAGKPITISLSAGDSYAADGAQLADKLMGRQNAYASGNLTFTPKAGQSYRVKGTLAKEVSSVWLEEDGSGALVGKKIVGEE